MLEKDKSKNRSTCISIEVCLQVKTGTLFLNFPQSKMAAPAYSCENVVAMVMVSLHPLYGI